MQELVNLKKRKQDLRLPCILCLQAVVTTRFNPHPKLRAYYMVRGALESVIELSVSAVAVTIIRVAMDANYHEHHLMMCQHARIEAAEGFWH